MNKKKMLFFITLMSGMTQAAFVLYTPSFLQISQSLGISSALVKTTLTSYLLGFGISQLFYGSLSDRYGRKPMALVGMIIFAIGCLWSIFAQDYSDLFFSRAIQGLGIGSCMTLSRTILRDCFEGKEYVKYASFLSSGFAIGLGVSPVIGGYLVHLFSWRAEFVFLFLCAVALFIGFCLFLPETHKPNEKVAMGPFLSQTFRNFDKSVQDKRFICYLVGGVMAYGVVIAYTTMTPFLFQRALGASPYVYGWLTFILAIFYFAATSANRMFVSKIGPHKMMAAGLVLILLSGVAMLIFYSFDEFNIPVVFLPLCVATFGQALIWSNAISGALKDLSHIAGTAASFFSFLQMILSAIVSAIIALPKEVDQFPVTLTVLILGVIAWITLQMGVFGKRNA